MASIAKLKITESEEHGRTLVVVTDDGSISVMPISGNVQAVLDEYAETQDPEVLLGLLDAETAALKAKEKVYSHLTRISRCLTTDGMHVFYDGAPFDKIQLDPALEKHLVKLITHRDTPEGEHDFKSWAAFAENLYGNVTPYIRGQLVSWLESQGWLTFSEDGCIVGYRGGQINEDTGIAESIHKGPGVVNGDVYNGHIPNPDGGVVEIDRSMVVDDPAVGCASGMHVGTFDYAKGWAQGVVMRVKVDPRDVISVPVDCCAQKIRCCRFTVLDHVNTGDEDAAGKFAEWGEVWTYGGDEDWECGWDAEDEYRDRIYETFEDYFYGGGGDGWDLLFPKDEYAKEAAELEADGVYDPEEYEYDFEEWCYERMVDLLDAYLAGLLEDDKTAAWESVFGAFEADAEGDAEDGEADDGDEGAADETESPETAEVAEDAEPEPEAE